MKEFTGSKLWTRLFASAPDLAANVKTVAVQAKDLLDRVATYMLLYTLHNERQNVLRGVSDPRPRPVTFLYSGGPGSASLWLHRGSIGPVCGF